MDAATPDKPKTIRLTIPVDQEVHATFARIAKASGMPIGRAMAEWMADTLDAAEYLAETLEKARAAPRLVARQLHSYAMGLADETGALLEQVRQDSRTRIGRAQTGLGASGGLEAPPSCNTGGKVPSKPPKRPRGDAR
jgi:hypothetical protein